MVRYRCPKRECETRIDLPSGEAAPKCTTHKKELVKA